VVQLTQHLQQYDTKSIAFPLFYPKFLDHK
jgi:hypothetical protein